MIPKVASSQERDGSLGMPATINASENTIIDGIPEMDELQATELWDDVNKNAMEQWSNNNVSPPFSKIDFGQELWNDQSPKANQDEI